MTVQDDINQEGSNETSSKKRRTVEFVEKDMEKISSEPESERPDESKIIKIEDEVYHLV